MINEKQKAAKDAGKKKKGAVGKKSNLQTGPKGLDTTNYDGESIRRNGFGFVRMYC